MQFFTPIFSDRFKHLLNQKYDQFEKGFINDWLYNTYLGEYETTIAYPQLKSKFEFDNYQDLNLSAKDKHIMCKYFDRMIDDETLHSQMLLNLLENHDKHPKQDDLNKVNELTNDRLNSLTVSQLLNRYYVGECYLWTGFYLTYKNCLDPQTAKIFHRLVVDESHHNNNILKIYKKLQHSISFDSESFINDVKSSKYLGLNYVKIFFELNDDTSKKSQWWLDLIYNHDWHQKFNLIFLKKTFKLYELFNPECNIDHFRNLIDKKSN